MTRCKQLLPSLVLALPLVALGCDDKMALPPGDEVEADAEADAGEHSEVDSACNAAHLCFTDGCGQSCAGPADCPADFTCLLTDGAAGICTRRCALGVDTCGCGRYCAPPIGGDGDTAYCFDDPPCTKDEDCVEPLVCGALRKTCDGTACTHEPFCGTPECTPGTAECAGPGETCAINDATCYNGFCLGSAPPTCHEVCGTDLDCPDERVCRGITVWVSPAEGSTLVQLCLEPQPPCGRDEDCPPGLVCGIDIAMSPTCVEPLCTRGAADCGDSGDDCSGSTLCYNRSCLGNGDAFVCHEFCRFDQDVDCDVAGQLCRRLSTPEGVIDVCVTMGEDCQRDEDCGANLVCGKRRGLEIECREEAGEAGTRVYAGETCNTTDRPCYNGLCLGKTVDGEFSGTCYELCDPEREDAEPTCPGDLTCGQLRVSSGGDETLLDVCKER